MSNENRKHPILTEKYADKLAEGWNLAYQLYNTLEELRPAGGFESFIINQEEQPKTKTPKPMNTTKSKRGKTKKPARQILKVVKKPMDSFPYGVGSEMSKPPYIRAIEWIHGGNLHTRTFEDLVNDGYLEDISEYPEPTLKSIQETYQIYGYLEDYQVDYLINTITILKDSFGKIIDGFEPSEDVRDKRFHNLEMSIGNINNIKSVINKI